MSFPACFGSLSWRGLTADYLPTKSLRYKAVILTKRGLAGTGLAPVAAGETVFGNAAPLTLKELPRCGTE